ncbi:MAG: type II toxin-antitoxin system HicA family toxin [Deltaproteobacteria bacterium]|nr:type II toxin-antitoxin system HicA family toxin [Deltaproteobacteria bacterium]
MKRSATDYTGKDLVRVARKLGHITVEGKKHIRVYDVEGGYIITIPRSKIKTGLLSAILKQLGITEAELKRLR